MSPQAFTELGLALDIAGAILLFFFGLPHKVLIDDDSADWVGRWRGATRGSPGSVSASACRF